jgi:uncharacterized protein YndB with AHSA1/START domain
MDQAQLTLEGDTDVVIRRSFSHPPEKVWRALTDPALIRQWLSPDGTLTRYEMDARPGGSFRYDWPQFFFSGPVLEARAPHHLVLVEHFNGDTTQGPTVTTTLAAAGAGTRMTVIMRYRDPTTRAAAIEQGFTDGIEDVYGRIESLAFPAA